MTNNDLRAPAHALNMRLVGHSDQGGRSDGTQIMVRDGYAYVAHIFSKGFSVIDVRDPANPCTVNFIPAPPNTWSLHLQVHDNLLLAVHGEDHFATPASDDEKNYYKADTHDISKAIGHGARDYSAGMAVFDLSDPVNPRQIGFMPVNGVGLHRIWYVGGRWAYASAQLEGFSDFILVTIDMSDPTRPEIVGKFWLPGMNIAAGETPDWPLSQGRYSLHHPIVHGDTAYCGWRDGCLVVVDVADRAAPKMLAHRNWAPPLAAAPTIACPCPTGICSSLPMRPCSTMERMATSRSGCSTSATRPIRCRSRPFRNRQTGITKTSAGISGRTIFMKTAPAALSAPR
ncbi:hypothetical protein [Hoeflea ulvae]|uniref:LVIVD repeat-containing protein n=1 Tax=Hoeflea ulvae TaxID=2983764 RepID=UPI002D1E3F4E|nr:hypothetical protein [Hoeflea ulvae]